MGIMPESIRPLENPTYEELRQGYRMDTATGAMICVCCGKIFEAGEIFEFEGRYFEAARAIRMHLERAHPDRFGELLRQDSKYNTLTANQKELFTLFHQGLSDAEIAEKLGVSPSTIRHQKFVFRERAKQARLYLVLYEQAIGWRSTQEDAALISPPPVRILDERFDVTDKERNKILSAVFESLEPLKLRVFSAKEKRKVVALTRIVEEFERERSYTEKEVNQILKAIFDDYVTLRRYLIEYGFLDRTRDCRTYWRK